MTPGSDVLPYTLKGVALSTPTRLRALQPRAHEIYYGGLGLAILRGLIERHGGRIWAESTGRKGESRTFHVVLPKGPG